MAINFFTTILVARYLGPESFGALSYAISLVALFTIAGHAGLSGLVVKELVKQPHATDLTMGTSFLIKGGGYLVGLLLLVLFAMFSEKTYDSEFWILIILSTTLLLRPFDVIDFWFQSRLESKYTTLSRTCGLLVSSLTKVVLVFVKSSLILFAFAHALQTLISSLMLIGFYHLKSRLRINNWSASIERAKELFSQSWLIFLGSIFAVIYLKIDQVMLKWLSGKEEVGLYAVASTLSEAWYFVPTAIVASVFPKLIRLKDSDPETYRIRMQQIYDILFILSLIVATAVTFFATPIINIMFGSDYQESSSILVIHIWAALFIFMRAVFSKWIIMENVLIFSLITQGMGALTNIILNWIWIPEHGGIGAAYATLLSYAMASYFALLFYSKTRPVFWMMTKAIFSPARYLASIR